MRLLKTEKLIRLQQRRLVGGVATRLLRVLSAVEVPVEVSIGSDLRVHHHGFGLVVHERTTIGNRVHLFHGVTLGRADVWTEKIEEGFGGIVLEDDVWVCAGAKVLGGAEEIRVARGTIVGANAVLLESTAPWEIWAGSPARCVGSRPPSVWQSPTEIVPIEPHDSR